MDSKESKSDPSVSTSVESIPGTSKEDEKIGEKRRLNWPFGTEDDNSFTNQLRYELENDLQFQENSKLVGEYMNVIHKEIHKPRPIEPPKSGNVIIRMIHWESLGLTVYTQKNLPPRSAWTSLIDHYLSEDSWMTPLLWEPSFRLATKDHLVELHMEILDLTGHFMNSYSSTLASLFDPFHDNETRPYQVLVRGDAGFGKSSLCCKLAYDWASQVQIFPSMTSESSLVLLYKLRNLEPDSCLETELFKFAQRHFYLQGVPDDIVEAALRSYEDKLLIILDGFDEVNTGHKEQVETLLSLKTNQTQSVFKLSSVIVTSRPHTEKEFLLLFHKHILLTGLSLDNGMKLIAKYFEIYYEPDLQLQFMRSIFQRPFFIQWQAFDNLLNVSPLFILIVCHVYRQEGSPTAVYANNDIFGVPLMVGSANIRKNFIPEENDPPHDPSQTIVFGDIEIIGPCISLMVKRANIRNNWNLDEHALQAKLVRLGEFFHQRLKTKNVVFTLSELRDFLPDDLEFVLLFDILKTSRPTPLENDVSLEPVHKIFMETIALMFVKKTWSTFTSDDQRKQFLETHFGNVNRSDLVYQSHQHVEILLCNEVVLATLTWYRDGSFHPDFMLYSHQLHYITGCMFNEGSIIINVSREKEDDWVSVISKLADVIPEIHTFNCIADVGSWIPSTRFLGIRIILLQNLIKAYPPESSHLDLPTIDETDSESRTKRLSLPLKLESVCLLNSFIFYTPFSLQRLNSILQRVLMVELCEPSREDSVEPYVQQMTSNLKKGKIEYNLHFSGDHEIHWDYEKEEMEFSHFVYVDDYSEDFLAKDLDSKYRDCWKRCTKLEMEEECLDNPWCSWAGCKKIEITSRK